MGTNAGQIAEFYQQLALLIQSELPLPDSLQMVGRQLPQPAFRDAVSAVGDRVAAGESLAKALGEYPQFFSPFHIKLLEVGEQSATLPELLHIVAGFAKFKHSLANAFRSVLAYPLLSSHVAAITLLVVFIGVIPQLEGVLRELPHIQASAGAMEHPSLPVPLATRWIFAAADLVSKFQVVAFAAYGILLIYSIWLFTPGYRAQRASVRILDHLPGSWQITRTLESSRICSMLGVFLNHGIPVDDSLDLVQHLVGRPRTARALQHAAAEVRNGKDIASALQDNKAIDRLVSMVFRHTPEARVAEELAALADLFNHRVIDATRIASYAWTATVFAIVGILTAGVALAAFYPIYQVASEFTVAIPQ